MLSSEPPPITIIVSSLSALLLALSTTDRSSIRVVYVPIKREKGEVSKFRDVESQTKIVTDIGQLLGFETHLCYSRDEIDAQLLDSAPKNN